MVRVINYFDTQVRVPTGEDIGEHMHNSRQRDEQLTPVNGTKDGNGAKSAFETHLHGNPTFRKMSDEQKVSWYGKILEGVRLRYRKLQRFARSVSHSSTIEIVNSRLISFQGSYAAIQQFGRVHPG